MRFFALSLLALFLIPTSAFALEGIGPRIFVTGTIQEIRITEKQAFNQIGGELTVKATNGQLVTVVLLDAANIISEGRLSRKSMIPSDLRTGMLIRTNGWRVDSKTISASLVIVLNVALNPVLSSNGIIQSIEGSSVSILCQDAVVRTFKVTNETQVNVSYDLQGSDGLTLIGKQAYVTVNPDDSSLIRILRITQNVTAVPTPKPTTVEMKRR